MKFLFYKQIKVDSLSGEDVLFWSDTHFGHKCLNWERPLWKARGYSSIEEHDEQLILNWNNTSTPNTTFFHLGDFMFGMDTIQRFKDLMKRLIFQTLYIMPGNHCSGWKQNFEEQVRNVWDVDSTKRVVFIPNYVECYVNKQPIVLSHYPLASFNGQGKGSWMLHGHCHGNLYKSALGPILYKAKITEVGVDKAPYPVSYTQLNKFFGNYAETITFDHHSVNTKNPF